MESSECRRRTSDAEQSAQSCSVTVKCEPAMVKEEPEWGECGVSEAAAAEGLYAGHEVKDELVIAPEQMQQQDVAFSMTDGLHIKEENQHEAKTEAAAAVAEGLYAGHQVKYELVIGPEVVQQQDIAYSMQDVLNIKYEWKREPKLEDGADTAAGCTRTCPGDGPRCHRSTEQQYGLRSCSVRLERLPVGDLHRSTPFSVSRDGEPSHSLAPSKLKPVHCGVGNSRAREVPASCQPHPSDKQFRAESKLAQHVQLHTHRPYGCDTCGQRFKERPHLTDHLRKHTGEKPYSCDVCNERFINKSTLTKHVRVHTGERPFGCNMCGHRFKKKSYLKSHIRMHTGEKPYSCDVCNKQFVQKSTLPSHMLIHTGEKPYSCDVCNKQFALKSTLTSHMLIHTGEKPYGCDVCNKQFSHKSTLTSHMLIHTGEKPYSCDVCNKRFRGKSTLTNHVRVHTGERPFGCNMCGQRFNHKSNLEHHIRIHTGKKPYSCEVCNKRFGRKSQVTRHVRVHTGEKPYSCDVCNKLFRCKVTLTRHKLIHK